MSGRKPAELAFATEADISRTRRLPVPGEVLVKEGDTLAADTVVARAQVPGYPVDVKVAFRLGVEPQDTPGYMLKGVGERLAAGEPLARRKILLGLSEELVVAPVSGTIESVSDLTGVVILRTAPVLVERVAYVPGRVIRVLPSEGCVVESRGTLLQGLFGVGGETFGPICVPVAGPDQVLEADQITRDMKGAVLVAGKVRNRSTLYKARDAGVQALVTGSIDDEELAGFLGREIGLAITGQEQAGLTIIVTDGFGDMPMSAGTFAVLQQLEGLTASVNGTTHIRAEALRPEIFVAR